MPKMLIVEATNVVYDNDKGGQHADSGEIVEVTKDVARKLVNAGRALYVNKADDPEKSGVNTASKEMVEAACKLAKTKAAAEKAKQAAVPAPAGGAGVAGGAGSGPVVES